MSKSEIPPKSPRDAARARLDALASLLVDESPQTYREVRRELSRFGRAARPTLERASRSDAPLARARARAMIADLERRPVVRRLVRYAARPAIDLERALFLLARLSDPSLDPRPFQRTLDTIAHDVARRAKQRVDPLERALTLVEVLGKELGFGGSKGDFHHPDNIHLHRVIERRAGMPLSLCAIYLCVARRAGIRAGCLPLPGHVMLRLYGDTTSVIVDPYHKGETRSERECRRYLDQHGLAYQAAWFRDAKDSTLWKRQITNLARSAELRGLDRERRELALLLAALEPRPRASAPASK